MIKVENEKVIITMEVDGETKTFVIIANDKSLFVILPAATNLLHMVGGMAAVFSCKPDIEEVAEELQVLEQVVFESWQRAQEEEKIDDQNLSDLLGDIKI